MHPVRLSRIAVVSDDADRAETVCQHFRRAGTYLAAFEAPPPRMEKWGMFDTDYIRIANAISFLQPSVILLHITDERRLAQLMNQLQPHHRDMAIDLASRGMDVLKDVAGYRAENLSWCDFIREEPVGDVVAVEQGAPFAATIGANLASAEGGCLYVLPPSSFGEADDFWDTQHTWMNSPEAITRDDALRCMLNQLSEKMGLLAEAHASSISFITQGIGYGLYPLKCPCTHFLSFPLLGVSVLAGMLKTAEPSLRCPVAYICDPQECGETEFESLRRAYGEAGYVLRATLGKSATVRSARHLSQHLPLDWVFFATHCGEVSGRRITESFSTPGGRQHTVVYDNAVGFSPNPRTGLIEVIQGMHWVSIDGVDWGDASGKREVGAGKLLEEYIEMRRRWSYDEKMAAVVKTEDAGIVRGSEALKMHDSNYMPAFHNIGGYMSPVVFSNACSSWPRFAVAFTYAGASVYIGAGCDLPNALAVGVAETFARRAARGGAIGPALSRAQARFSADLGYAPYLMHGYLFTALKAPGQRLQNVVDFRDQLVRQIDGWKDHLAGCDSDEVRRNVEEILADLKEDLQSVNDQWGLC